MNEDKIVVFDAGRVLIDFSFDPFEAFLKAKGARINSPEEFFVKTKLYDFEIGKISIDEFLSNIADNLEQKVSGPEISAEWTSIFSPIEQMLNLCRGLKTQVRTCILSNTNELHWLYLEKEYGLGEITNKAFTSHKLGVMKPNSKIYEALEQYAKIPTEEILFIDDLEANVEAAKSRGWKGIVHTDYIKTKEAIERFLK